MHVEIPFNAVLRHAAPSSEREILAEFDDEFLWCYQAYSPAIAEAAVRAGRFAEGWKLDRATWIKPSIEWMMYRCGYGRKSGQERVLRLAFRHADFLAILGQGVVADFVPEDGDERQRRSVMDRHAVRIQWDPARDLALRRMPWRAIQIGITARLSQTFRDEWVKQIQDVTEIVQAIERDVSAGRPAQSIRLPAEQREYAIPVELRRRLEMPSLKPRQA
ncbi:MAG: DUF4291 family protein [Planctomycetes bacterium]|nr:DUF4291 family protein [Planctomycetota bacterium]MCC7064304.1 DUF4291 family protein [Planctomycetota bacterium]